MAANNTVIWQFTDGKAGHENQTTGLINAMRYSINVSAHSIQVPNHFWACLLFIFSGRFLAQLKQLPKPDYLIAAGHRTHLPMLIARCFFGGQAILLMRSFWPYHWFEHVIIPHHDSPPNRDNILVTQGVINNVTPASNPNKDTGIILIGGYSKHYHWNTPSIIEQINHIIMTSPETQWTVANSRRTPKEFEQHIPAELRANHINYIDHQAVSATWLKEHLTGFDTIWVSPDSVSMVYESITSGVHVGCLYLEKKTNNRIVNGIDSLIKHNMLTSYAAWQSTQHLTKPASPLFEAQRAADWILSR